MGAVKADESGFRPGGSKTTRGGSQFSNMSAPANIGTIYRNLRGGLSDMRDIAVTYPCGYTFTGDDGTLGKTGKMYWSDQASGAATLVSLDAIPIAPGDANVGQSYLADLFKHFTRVVYKKIGARLRPTGAGSSTANQTTHTLAPYRGFDRQTTYATTKTTDVNFSNVTALGVRGAQTAPVWMPLEVDLTPYITGGTGPSGREFNIGSNTSSSSASSAANSLHFPAGLLISGDNGTGAVRTSYSELFIDAVFDLIDFIGNYTESNPAPDDIDPWACRRAREKVGVKHVEQCPRCQAEYNQQERRRRAKHEDCFGSTYVSPSVPTTSAEPSPLVQPIRGDSVRGSLVTPTAVTVSLDPPSSRDIQQLQLSRQSVVANHFRG